MEVHFLRPVPFSFGFSPYRPPPPPPLPLPYGPPPPLPLSLSLPLPLPAPLPAPHRYQFPGPYTNPNIPRAKYYKWAKPLHPFCTLNTDGSLTKDSKVGGLLRNCLGESIFAFADVCNEEYPVYAVELWAIKIGLGHALSSGVRFINVDTDSTDAVSLIYSDPSACPSLVQDCIIEIQALLGQFSCWEVKHVFRETNRRFLV
ncbi:hypothetical protein IFM89_008602 [Coptis chinensis]|uniref:RNase H type-1 domain-containing protein n=1 Tax=Coptis chinensis TaxID=261450 RepID=A0A835LPT1_9MAGN|nr:hypothetical protein IFM89_008602 [Coptis chinensis]